MMRCDQCKFWQAANEYDDNAQVLGVRKCGKAVELWEASEWNDEYDRVPKPEYAGQKMFVMDGSSYAASLYTAADFFCAHFEALKEGK